jgi:predicted kinase
VGIDCARLKAFWKSLRQKPPILILLMGIPGSGKTTVRSLFKIGWHIGSSDDLIPTDKSGIRDYSPNNLRTSWHQVWQDFAKNLQQKNNIILDNTFINGQERSAICNIAKGLGYFTVCIWINTPLEKCQENNLTRFHSVPPGIITKKSKGLQKPGYQEGWHLLVTLVDKDLGIVQIEDHKMLISEYISKQYNTWLKE